MYRKKTFNDHVNQKKKVLEDFGISSEIIDELFENHEFLSLRALDVFANNVLRSYFKDETKFTKEA
ncbi:MAG: hypothetical protein UHN47_07030 [Lachnospiraceae bacterium]|nr:hypothetical protein [Lachnospiraceae bacterium]